MKKQIAILMVSGLFLTACAGSKDIPEMAPEDLYKNGVRLFDKTNYEEAAKYFDEVERQHPYSEWAARAQIMAAYSFYKKNQYDDAILALDRFIQLHPGNKNTPYAYYLKGLCYYEQISDIAREQQMTVEAKEIFQDLLARYPDSVYAKDVAAKLEIIEDQLVGQDMTVGRYYLKGKEYFAAMNRFQSVIKQYPESHQVNEAMYRLVVCYVSLGMDKSAKTLNQKIQKKFPKTKWSEKSARVIAEYIPQQKAKK